MKFACRAFSPLSIIEVANKKMHLLPTYKKKQLMILLYSFIEFGRFYSLQTRIYEYPPQIIEICLPLSPFFILTAHFPDKLLVNNNSYGFQVFQMTVLDVNYNIAPFLNVDPFMARLLSCTYVFISFVVVLNLIIAMITDTFKRVFSYAQEHAAMERAKTIINIEDSMREKTRKRYWEFIRNQCSPLIINSLTRHGRTMFSEMVIVLHLFVYMFNLRQNLFVP